MTDDLPAIWAFLETAVRTRVSWLGHAADLLTALLAAFALVAAALRPIGLVRRHALSSALRRPLRRSRSRSWQLDRDADPSTTDVLAGPLGLAPGKTWNVRTDVRRRRRIVSSLWALVDEVLEGGDLMAADLVAEVISTGGDGTAAPWPFYARRLSRLLRVAGTNRAPGLWAKLLYPEMVRTSSHFMLRTSEHLRRFCEATPLSAAVMPTLFRPRDAGSETPVPFPVFATALSGAVVLVDASETRSGYANDVLVWHSRRFRSEAEPPAARARYDDDHSEGRSCRLWAEHERRAGDHDRRLMTVRSVGMCESSARGTVSFVLETSETCYAASERGQAGRTDAPAVGCKNVKARAGRDGHDPLFDLQPWPTANRGHRVVRTTPDEGRVMLLTSYAALISSDGYLVLTRRNSRVTHGGDSISASVGGLVAPGGPGRSGDVDEHGMPDPVLSLVREAREELGITLDPTLVSPVAVFATNIAGSKDPFRGQLVAAVLSLCRVTETAEEIRRSIARSDPSRGSYKVDGVVGVATQGGPRRPWSPRSRTAAQLLADFAAQRAHALDQHGLLSCLYAAAALTSPEDAQEAFTEAFRDEPWWSTSANGRVRVVRDPRDLLAEGAWPLEGAVPRWRGAWDGLADRLTTP